MSGFIPRIKIKGLGKTLAEINALDGKMVLRVSDAIKRMGRSIAADAQNRLAYGEGVRTGFYWQNIKSRFYPNQLHARIASWINDRPNPLGHLIEFGHKTANGGRTRAFPHLLPAFDRGKQEFEKEIRDAIKGLEP